MLAGLQERASIAAFAHVFPPDRYPFPRADVHERWAEALEDPAAWIAVAELESEAVGVALVRPEWLEGLYVAPDWWGKGVADRLHDRALEHAEGLGLRAVPPLGPGGESAGEAFLRAARLARERAHASRPVPAQSARRRLHARLLD